MKRRKILIGCFGLSLLLHVMSLCFLERYSVWFSSHESPESNSDWLSLVDKKERDQILKTAFEPKLEKFEEIDKLEPTEESFKVSFNRPTIPQGPELIDSMLFQSVFAFSINEPLITKSPLPTFTIPSKSSINLLDYLPKDLIVPLPYKKERNLFLPFPTESTLALNAKPPSVQKDAPTEKVTYTDFLDKSLTESPQVGKAPPMIPIPDLPKLPTLAELGTASYSDSFDADLVFLPKDNGEGYIFALTLIPRPDLNLPRFRQHITFLFDRSNSIQQKRLRETKAAMHKTLAYLHDEDTFNIVAFDSKTEKMSPNALPCVGKSFAIAEEFLERIQLGSFFSTSDLLHPLVLTVPGKVHDDEVHTAILITDGETLASNASTRALLYDWTRYNNGRVSLFAVGMNDINSSKLETLTAFNKGKVFSSISYRGLKRKLPKLLKTIQNPIAKNLVCNAISKSPQSEITLFPRQAIMPNLYLEQPYVILGETDSLNDFILFVQGRLKGRWLNIRKTVSFLNARKGNASLRKEIALQKAYDLYEKHIVNPSPSLIAEVKELLAPYDYQFSLQ